MIFEQHRQRQRRMVPQTQATVSPLPAFVVEALTTLWADQF